MIAVDRARCRVNEPPHPGITRGNENVDEAVDVRRVRGDGVRNRARHRAERGLVQHDVDASAREAAGIDIAYVGFDEPVPIPSISAHLRAYIVEVSPVARCETVEADDRL